MTDTELMVYVKEIVGKYLPGQKVIYFFGSRTKGRHSDRSDYDFGIDTGNKIPLELMCRMKEELERLPTLHRIDLVDFQRASTTFIDYAKSNAILL
jgi:predicted nucleotidyltransferase